MISHIFTSDSPCETKPHQDGRRFVGARQIVASATCGLTVWDSEDLEKETILGNFREFYWIFGI